MQKLIGGGPQRVQALPDAREIMLQFFSLIFTSVTQHISSRFFEWSCSIGQVKDTAHLRPA